MEQVILSIIVLGNMVLFIADRIIKLNKGVKYGKS